MRLNTACVLLILSVLCVVENSQCAKILVIIPTASYSHQVPYWKFLMELHKRGHKMVFVTPTPIPNYNKPNFTHILLENMYSKMKDFNYIQHKLSRTTWFDFIEHCTYDIRVLMTETVFNHTEMQRLYTPGSNATFDLVIAEYIYTASIYAFAHRFNAPLIGLTSLGLLRFHEHNLGGMIHPSHEYTWELEADTGFNLSFFERLRNFVRMWKYLYYCYYTMYPHEQLLAERYLGPLPPLLDIAKNVSLIFIDQSDVISPARPKHANIITFTSTHINEKSQPLPKDLQTFLNETKDGFIYFSLGTNVKDIDLPLEVQQMLRDVFARLPYKIVWKHDGVIMDKPKNIYTAPWVNQQSILAHPNIKLFIYQGGLQSSEEAIHYGVPILGFPVMADQYYQVNRMVTLGIGGLTNLLTTTSDEFENTIREMITNQKYKESMINIRKLSKDIPYDAVQNLVWWTEYVIRTKGAKHLHSNLAHQPWYQRTDTDIIVFLTIILFVIVSTIVKQIYKLMVYTYRFRQIFPSDKQKTS